MLKKDDCTLPVENYLKVRLEAERILKESGAMGRFPTPVADIMCAARIEVVDDNIFSEKFLAKIRKKAGALLKSALSKTLGLLDVKGRMAFIDKTVYAASEMVRNRETA